MTTEQKERDAGTALPGVDSRCRVVTDYRNSRDVEAWVFCNKPSTHWYPTKNGTQSLCMEHAQQHLPHGAWPIGTPSPWSVSQ